jgi:rubrerythrin
MKKMIVIVLALIISVGGFSQSKSGKTIENLKAGIKGETTASAKYAAFAKKAMDEGRKEIAKLFEAASKAEAIHADNHRKVLEGMGEKMDKITPQFEVKTTAENLQAAIDGENYEVSTMYPQFMKDAADEKAEKAQKSFRWAQDTEKKHSEFYTAALKALKSGTENTLAKSFAVCPVCGNTYDNAKADPNCAFCGTPKARFIVV